MLGGAVLIDEIFDDDDRSDWDSDDIDWDRGDITINRGNVTIGGGDRPLREGERGALGSAARDGERVQSIGAADATRAAARSAGVGSTISDQASREVARQKIETRKATGKPPAQLGTSRPSSFEPRGAAQPKSVTRPASAVSRPGTSASRPQLSRAPKAKPVGGSNAFKKPSHSTPAASSSRGRSSAGKRNGDGRR